MKQMKIKKKQCREDDEDIRIREKLKKTERKGTQTR